MNNETQKVARSRLGLTEAGKVMLHGIGFVAFTALIFPAFGVLSALVWVMLTALLAGFVLRPRIRLSGNLPDRVMAGQTAPLRYQLENVGRFGAYNLCVRFGALPEAIEQVAGEHVISRLGPGETVEVTVAIRPKRRGRYQIKQPVCQSSFPFNLFSFGTSGGGQESLTVLPAFSLLRMRTAGMSRQVRTGSERLSGRMGTSPEYAGSRPFLPGDSPRKIDARAWARLSVPATKEYHDDLDNCAALILDTAVPEPARQPAGGFLLRSRPNEIKELEAAVSLCASLAYTINNDCLIDLLLAGPDLHQLTDRPRMVRLDAIHEILAGVEPSGGYCLEPMEPTLTSRFYAISDVFFILLGWSAAYGPLLKMAGMAGCRSTVLLVGRGDAVQRGRMGNSFAHAAPEQHGQENLPILQVLSWASDVQVLSPDEILAGQIVL